MSIDFTVVQAVRQRFGDQKADLGGGRPMELEAPFAGGSKDFPFACPGMAGGK